MATGKVVSEVAVKNSTGGLESRSFFGADTQNVFHTNENGITYRVKDTLDWVENYILQNRLVFQGKNDPKVNGVPTGNIGIFIDTSTTAVLEVTAE